METGILRAVSQTQQRSDSTGRDDRIFHRGRCSRRSEGAVSAPTTHNRRVTAARSMIACNTYLQSANNLENPAQRVLSTNMLYLLSSRTKLFRDFILKLGVLHAVR